MVGRLMGPPFSSQPEPGSGRKAGGRWGGVGEGGSQNVLKDTVVHFACKIVRDGLLGIHLFGPGALPRDSLVRRNGPAIDEPVPTSQFPSSRSYLALTQSYRGRSDPA